MLLNLLCWTIALIGHIGIWCVAFNRIHATALKRRYRKLVEKLIILLVIAPVAWGGFALVSCGQYEVWSVGLRSASSILYFYWIACLLVGPFFFGNWMRRRMGQSRCSVVRSKRREMVNVQSLFEKPLTHGWFSKCLAMVPGNQATQLAIEHRTFEFARLPQSLDGLRVVQLSDLHFTGQIRLDYFLEISRRVSQFEPDLIFITGDLVDEEECLEWIQPFFGSLKAKYGVHFVRGNHDLRISDQKEYLRRLVETGMINVANHWHVIDIDGVQIGVTGNERPWYRGEEDLSLDPEPTVDFRILLSHSPDQWKWALPYKFDWMLAGHCHGGQIQFPVVGPLVAPSKYGVKYAEGPHELGSMFMYVSRGISGDEPIRILCPPEVGFFTLKARG